LRCPSPDSPAPADVAGGILIGGFPSAFSCPHSLQARLQGTQTQQGALHPATSIATLAQRAKASGCKPQKLEIGRCRVEGGAGKLLTSSGEPFQLSQDGAGPNKNCRFSG